MRTVLVTGADGYCGWPIVLKLLKNGHRVIGIDNGARRAWVDEVKSQSVIPISDITTRVNRANQVYRNMYVYNHVDLTQYYTVHNLIDSYKPEAIIHLASQPSAPFSGIDVDHCNFTQQNNSQMLRNIMWAIDNLGVHDTHLIVTTTTGIYGSPDFDIPEGNLVVNKMPLPFPSMAGSWYHMSRAHDSNNMWLANKLFKFPMTELRTSIVCGSSTDLTKEYPEFRNRFDIDFYFGVVTMISLGDMVRSTVNCFEHGVEDKRLNYEIYNQLEQPIAIVDIANIIKEFCEEKFKMPIHVDHVPNPRVEDEEHQMVMDNRKFILDLCDSKIMTTVRSSIEKMCQDLYPYKNMIINILQRGK
jgi:nucleoside-diphosphate-sugar epimerase